MQFSYNKIRKVTTIYWRYVWKTCVCSYFPLFCFWWHCNMTDLRRTCLILEYQNNMFLQQAMIMNLLYYDHLLYSRRHGQEVYYYKNTQRFVFFVFFLVSRKRKENTGFIQTPCSHVFRSLLLKPSAIMYLYRNLLIAKNCMVDGRLHELCLSSCGSTIIQLRHF